MNTEVFVGAFIPIPEGQHRRLAGSIVPAYRARESLNLRSTDAPFAMVMEHTRSNHHT